MFVLDECDKMLEETGKNELTSKSKHYNRHEIRCAAHLQEHSSRKASNDVFCHDVSRCEEYLQKVHEELV